MIRSSIRIMTCILLASVTVSAGACSVSKESRFYLLHPTMGSERGSDSFLPRPEISVGVGPVKFPDYLDRPQIVTRATPGKLDLAEFDRWAEPLSENFIRVLAEDISAALSTSRIVIYPWPRTSQPDCHVTVDVNQFEGVPGGRATLSARWTLHGEQGKKVLAQRNLEFIEPVDGTSYEALVAAQSRAVASLAREIATAVREAFPTRPTM